MACPLETKGLTDQSQFWDSAGLHWTPHRIGWAIAGGCAVLTVLISIFSVVSHCRNYTNPPQQRQILRILYMPPVYAIISFASYRFFRSYTYYSFIQAAYEAVGLSAFLLLLIEYVAATAVGKSAERALERKDKRPLPIPFCCWRYRPTKAYFLYTVKWSVLQYVIIRPAASLAGIICQKLGVLCQEAGFSPRWANVYIESINFVSISIALYGLLMFYGLTSEELKGRRPMAKFLAIKLIVMFTFYQSFVFSALENRVIHETEFWTATNVANGLNALTICIEMVFFALFMSWAYTPREYKRSTDKPATSVWKPLWDSINYSDFFAEIATSVKFYWSSATIKKSKQRRPDLAQAFGAEGRSSGSSGTTMTGFPSDRIPVLQAAAPRPFSSPSLHSQADDTNHIPLRMLEAKESKKEMERYSKIGIAH